MQPPTLDEFRAEHAQTLTRLYKLGRGRRWALSEDDFTAALHGSRTNRFRGEASKREVERYLGRLELRDLALVTALRRGVEHAWQMFHSDYLPVIHETCRAIIADPRAAHENGDALFKEFYGRGTSVFEQYVGRSRLKTWLRAVVARLDDSSIRSAGAVDTEIREAQPLIDGVAQALVALEPIDRLRIAAYALERLPVPVTSAMLGESSRTTISSLRKTAAAIEKDVRHRLSRERNIPGRGIAKLYATIAQKAPPGDLRDAFEIALALTLSLRLNAPGRHCPPPATLASLVEGRLTPGERDVAVLHVSGCRGCIRQLGVIGRLERAGLEVERLGLGDAPTRYRDVILGALVVVGGVAYLRFADAGVLADSIRYLTDSASTPPPSAAARRETPDAEPTEAPPLDPTPAAEAEAAAATPSLAAAPTPVDTPEIAGRAGTAPEDEDAGASATPTERPTLRPSPKATAIRASYTPTVGSRRKPTPIPTERPPSIATAAIPPPGERRPQARAVTVIGGPERKTRWLVGDAGYLEVSRDAGRTWQRISSGVGADLLTGSGPTERICWIGGRRGTLLRTIDGARFSLVASPTRDDVVRIIATDASRATITDARGRRFETDDGGRTWRSL